MEENRNNEIDSLEQALRSKLTHHTLPVDPLVWEAVRAKLKMHSPQHRRFKAWQLSLYAAASLAFLITLGWLYLTLPETAPRINEHQTADQVLIDGGVLPENGDMALLEQHSEKQEPDVDKLASSKFLSTPSIPLMVDNRQLSVSDSLDSTALLLDSMKVKPTLAVSKPQNETLKKTLQLQSTPDDWIDDLPIRRRKKPLLAAALGSGVVGGNPAASSMEFDRMYESLVPMAAGGPQRAMALVPADFRDKEYSMPVSLGMKFRWQLSGIWSMESGLQYTYLQTSMSDAAWQGYSANLQLHYMGIPLGLSASLLSSPKWELYWTGGMMVEKGLRSVYNEYRSWGAADFNTHVATGINGCQWSMYTSIGVGYRIDTKVMLYIDPQISYYFENDQPLSIRTVMPLMMGVSAGIRFEL